MQSEYARGILLYANAGKGYKISLITSDTLMHAATIIRWFYEDDEKAKSLIDRGTYVRLDCNDSQMTTCPSFFSTDIPERYAELPRLYYRTEVQKWYVCTCDNRAGIFEETELRKWIEELFPEYSEPSCLSTLIDRDMQYKKARNKFEQWKKEKNKLFENDNAR